MTSRSKEPRSAEGQRSLNVSHGLTLTALIFSAIEVIAAHCDSCAASCSTTIRTARDRTSGENLVGLGMAPSSQGLEPPGNPARFRSARPGRKAETVAHCASESAKERSQTDFE